MSGTEETVTVDDRTIQLFTGGEGSPLLYLHGAGVYWWMPVHDLLAARRRVYPGSGSLETIRFVAERRYPWIALPYSQFEVMKEHFDMLRAHAARHCGYDLPPAQVGWPAMIYVAETDRQAREEFEPHFWYLAKKGLRLPREYMFPPGHTSVESQLRLGHARRKFISLLTSWKEAEDGLYAIVGSPETVRQKLREGITAAGCGILQGIFQVGSMPHDLTMKNMELFAREVMPALRAEFP